MKLPKSLLVAAALLIGLTSIALARCERTPITWRLGETTTQTLTTDGSACVIALPYLAGKTRIFRAKLVSGPSHGSVTISRRTTIIYRPAEGFKGQDQYIYKYQGMEGLTPGAVTIRTDVTVN